MAKSTDENSTPATAERKQREGRSGREPTEARQASSANESAAGESSAETPALAGTPPGPRPGRLLAATAFLLAFAAMAAAAYLYFLLIYLEPNAATERALAQAKTERDALGSGLEQAQESWRQGLKDSNEQLIDRLQTTESGLLERLNQVAKAAPPSERDWQLAELEYLLLVANHRLLMERDIATALDLLRSADDILQGLEDMALHGVRSALAGEILSLEQTQGVDVQGLYLRLDALKRQLADLALAQPRFAMPQKTEANRGQDDGLGAALADEFRNLLRFRRTDAEVRRPLAPDEARYLELNLRLMLEQAQLAALKRDQAVFTSSLDAARQWVDEHLDAADPGVQAVSNALAELRQADLQVALPDISASSEELRKVRRGGANQ